MDVERRKLLKMLSGAFLANPGIPHVSSYLKASSSNDKMNHTTYDWRTPVKDKSHRKNVILLTFDDLRFDTFSFHGSSAKTPNIDALKNKSVYFSNACTTTGLCSPSRAALFTGRLGHRTGLDDNCHVWQSRLMGLSLQQETILEWARQKDYFVGHFGKWHLGPNGPMRRGVHRFSKKAKDFEKPRKLPDKLRSPSTMRPQMDFMRIQPPFIKPLKQYSF